MAAARGVRVVIDDGLPHIFADAGRVELVLVNLIANAIKYSDPAKSDRYVPYYVAEKLTEAGGDGAETKSYESGHELDEKARKDRLAWLRAELGL